MGGVEPPVPVDQQQCTVAHLNGLQQSPLSPGDTGSRWTQEGAPGRGECLLGRGLSLPITEGVQEGGTFMGITADSVVTELWLREGHGAHQGSIP